MIDILRTHLTEFMPFERHELDLILGAFQEKQLPKKGFLLREGERCDSIGFIAKGAIRHYRMYDGMERTCYVSLENNWVSDTQSFLNQTPSLQYYQALEASTLYLIERKRLYALYQECPKFESLSRMIYEQVATLATRFATSLALLKPEERYKELLQHHPEWFQRVPQKHIAHILGIQPESLSRIIKRLSSPPKS